MYHTTRERDLLWSTSRNIGALLFWAATLCERLNTPSELDVEANRLGRVEGRQVLLPCDTDSPELQQTLRRLFIGKRDKLLLFMLCKSCMDISTVPSAIQERIVQPPKFGLVG